MLDQKLTLVNKLLVLGTLLEEVGQESEELVPVHDEDFLDGDRLVRVGDKDLKHVEAFVLDHFAVVTQEVHADLEMLARIDVACHDGVVGTVEQDLAEKLDRLALGDVAVGLHEGGVVAAEEEVKVDAEVARYEFLVPGEEFLGVLAKCTEKGGSEARIW